MTTNQSSPQGRHSRSHPRPPNDDKVLKSEQVQIERKLFIFTLKENPRGRFLRITEDVAGRRDTIIVPAPGLDEFLKMVDGMAKASAEAPQPTA